MCNDLSRLGETVRYADDLDEATRNYGQTHGTKRLGCRALLSLRLREELKTKSLKLDPHCLWKQWHDREGEQWTEFCREDKLHLVEGSGAGAFSGPCEQHPLPCSRCKSGKTPRYQSSKAGGTEYIQECPTSEDMERYLILEKKPTSLRSYIVVDKSMSRQGTVSLKYAVEWEGRD
ncbi:hypothetical protein CNYM01_13849 [Colletotrichum nymphaeae SA-01]|uniref:Uncharacterized protein n=1 Tax=Colletotrichum nymphaeae SA-01 TaxID=1460502 RepID=A0A135TJD9_9PEZI|nr:hypothetical protein CNYM01_13849 [Colletotrichum nymphaeae SA-01]